MGRVRRGYIVNTLSMEWPNNEPMWTSKMNVPLARVGFICVDDLYSYSLR